MGDTKTKITWNSKPQSAKENWTKIPNVKTITCAACKSENTICIYSDVYGSNIGYYIEEEFFCNDCKNYTLFIEDYES
ncbi:MAG: hypothetical protein JXR51_01320 [Bacteroidales bacterium]|nr:hypothetical protein [Bacteroidales bacterium]MBN2755784.1 hypothetical protein [Bacteroidales bacterium]